MKNEFDELTKNLAQAVSRRQAFKKFSLGLAGMALACFGLANKAQAGKFRRGMLEVGPNLDVLYFTGQCIDPMTCQKGPVLRWWKSSNFMVPLCNSCVAQNSTCTF
jgi:hypothetical protein